MRNCYGYYKEIPFKVLFKARKESPSYNLAETEVQTFILQNKPEEEESRYTEIKEEVDISEERIFTPTMSTKASLSTNMENSNSFFLFFLQNHFLIEKMSLSN